MMNDSIPELSIRNLSVSFHSERNSVSAIEGIDFTLNQGKSVAIMGETGCGKSVLGLSCIRLLDDIAEVSGSIIYKGIDLYKMDEKELNKIRGNKISLIPQSASTAFDPVIRIGLQITEFIVKAGIAKGIEARERALHFLHEAGFGEPENIFNAYTHRLSGGMNERALIAMALSVEPSLIIADEPTKGLDTQAKSEILELLGKAAKTASMLLITHDFKTAGICPETLIMYSGQIIEYGPTDRVLTEPKHYYTAGLINAHPARGMTPIPGRHRLEHRLASGCRFRDRCTAADSVCLQPPELRTIENEWKVRCCHA